MRCKNCGWENNSNKIKCEKCNAPLSGSMIENCENRPLNASSGENLKGTVAEGSIFARESIFVEEENQHAIQCRKCHYPIGRGMQTCPMCGASVENNPKVKLSDTGHDGGSICNQCGAEIPAGTKDCAVCGTPSRLGTINPWARPQTGTFCTLKPLVWDNEQAEHKVLTFSGKNIMLNRANTDPNNQTITSAEQAELIFENGAWHICDKSSLKTTYLHVGHKTKIEKGDIILLGNRRFEFNY